MGCGSGTKPREVSDPKAVSKTGPMAGAPVNKCILIIGAPASGKGTQAEKIEKQYGFLYPHA